MTWEWLIRNFRWNTRHISDKKEDIKYEQFELENDNLLADHFVYYWSVGTLEELSCFRNQVVFVIKVVHPIKVHKPFPECIYYQTN